MAFERTTRVSLETPWENGSISVVVAAIEADVSPVIPPIVVYGLGVDIIYPSRLELPDKSLDLAFGTLSDFEKFISGLRAGFSLMSGPEIRIPDIDPETGLPIEEREGNEE